jgi:hypothetical protein
MVPSQPWGDQHRNRPGRRGRGGIEPEVAVCLGVQDDLRSGRPGVRIPRGLIRQADDPLGAVVWADTEGRVGYTAPMARSLRLRRSFSEDLPPCGRTGALSW